MNILVLGSEQFQHFTEYVLNQLAGDHHLALHVAKQPGPIRIDLTIVEKTSESDRLVRSLSRLGHMGVMSAEFGEFGQTETAAVLECYKHKMMRTSHQSLSKELAAQIPSFN